MISRPINEVSPPIDCNWVACHNPVIFEYQRQDFAISAVNNNGGFNQIVLAAPTLTPDYQAGDKITLLSSTSAFVVVAEITSIAFGVINTDVAWTGSAPDWGFVNINSRRLWYLEFTVGTRVLRLTPNAAGKINVDLSRALQTFVNLKNDVSYLLSGPANRADNNASNDVEYTLQEKWRGGSNTISAPFPLVVVSGAFQVGSTNDCFYVNHTIYDVPLSNTKFLTRFKQPSYWRGLPFDVQINIDQSCERALRLNRVYYDAQGNQTGFESNTLNVTRYGVLQRIVVDWDADQGTILDIDLRIPSGPTLYTETKRIKIKTSCDGYYLRWRNTLGGIDYWNFDSYKNETMTTQGVGIFAPYFETIEDARSTGEFTSKRASDSLNLQASALTADEMEGLMDLLSSPSVQIYEDEIWKTILIQPGTFNRYESGNLSKVEFQAIKVDKQIQSW